MTEKKQKLNEMALRRISEDVNWERQLEAFQQLHG
jgi:hypothetical protein